METISGKPTSFLQDWVLETQNLTVLSIRAILSLFRRPLYLRETFDQMDIIGVGSVTITMLTGFFSGAVMSLQTAKSLGSFGAVGYT